ncbi:MAG TPA: hypothetical protein VGI03_05600 [Verrucomicrobiae bacterium]
MKLKICCALMGASLFITPSVFAQIIGTGSLKITAPNYAPDQAGPYLVQIATSAGVTPGSTSFQTFCIGSQVDYSPGSTYSYQISNTVLPASVGSPGYVTWGTAYLYSQFLAGALGVGGTSSTTVATGTIDQTINDALQVAIWELQGQSLSGITYGAPLNTADVNQFLTDAANAASAANVSNDENEANGAFGIYALNMSSGSTPAQPELVQVAVPEASTILAGALMILPLGIGAFRALRKVRVA